MNHIIQGAAAAAAVIVAIAFLLRSLRPLFRAHGGGARTAFKSRWRGDAPAMKNEERTKTAIVGLQDFREEEGKEVIGGGCSPSACASCRGCCGLR